jgi:hypothetical protein
MSLFLGLSQPAMRDSTAVNGLNPSNPPLKYPKPMKDRGGAHSHLASWGIPEDIRYERFRRGIFKRRVKVTIPMIPILG